MLCDNLVLFSILVLRQRPIESLLRGPPRGVMIFLLLLCGAVGDDTMPMMITLVKWMAVTS